MSLLQIFFIVSGVVIFILAIDIANKKKFNAIHFLIFLFIWIFLLIFSFFPNFLNYIWWIFGLQRWADLLVYSSIIFLIYFVLLLLKKVEDNKDDTTKLIREIAIENSLREILSWKIWFVIPAYNEEKVIKSVITKLLKKNYKNIVVINDWSKDNTLNILQEFWKKVIVLNHYNNRWQWASLETGFEYFRRYWKKTEYVCTFDSDWQHDLNDLNEFLKILEKNKDIEVVLGSRFITKTNTNIWFTRKIILKLGIVFTFFVSNIKLTDSHNGYRVFRTKTLDKIRLTIDWMWHSSEIVDIISTKNIKFMEVPVNIKYTDYSLKKWQKSSNAINIALKFIWNKFFR